MRLYGYKSIPMQIPPFHPYVKWMQAHPDALFKPSVAHVLYLVDMTLIALQRYCEDTRRYNFHENDGMPTENAISELETNVLSLMFEADPMMLIHNIRQAATLCDLELHGESTTGGIDPIRWRLRDTRLSMRLNTDNIAYCYCLAFTDMCCQLKGHSSIIDLRNPPLPQLASLSRDIRSKNEDLCHGILKHARLCHWIKLTVNNGINGVWRMIHWENSPDSTWGDDIIQYILEESIASYDMKELW
jgi:hypothetical protein